MVFRYGGEEFVVILTETPLENSIIPLERLRKAVEASKFVFNKQEIKVTVSIGASSINEEVTNAWEMFDLADKALYFAKENGRNQVKLSS